MLIKNKKNWFESENDVTSESLYLNRRSFMRGAAGVAGATGLIGMGLGSSAMAAGKKRDLALLDFSKSSYDPGETLTPENTVTQYNNYYEFGTDKGDPARNAWQLQPKPWSVQVDGMVDKPATYAFEDLVDMKTLEERIYRLRCVETWSMIIPWIGVPMAAILEKVGVQSGAKYVAFETLADEKQMPGVKPSFFGTTALDWPYKEGLTLPEAMNPLTFMAVGLYGKEIPNQNGAPLRLVVPWKYGYKSIKSIVRITLTDRQPPTSWNQSAPREYGFYSNVNPTRSHPRWSQAKERRLGEFGRRPTAMFNGYGDEVAHLYAGLDLNVNH